ncbi:hypothetical protein G4B88_008094 [Cannabis sativa]|uniref:Reverse transcriptase zinc-binding domain-containing protein n=1 Tax=Cannabis sativa TaxID=3483 RepID=A0A7J6I8S2_CANSA|nr:hypothetical protein G4B88_008094 [Cannabis sativa]
MNWQHGFIIRCYNLFVEENQAVNAGAIWDKLVVPKHRFIYWQIFNTHLLTRDYLQQILVIPSNLCPVCDSALETHDHFYAIQVFAAVNKWMGNFQWPRSIEEMVRGCCNLKKNLTDRIINTVLADALYFLWKSRNKCIFDLSCLTPSCLSLGIKDTVRWRLISKGPFKDCKRNKYLLNLLVSAAAAADSPWEGGPVDTKGVAVSAGGSRSGCAELTLHAPCVVEDRLAILLQSYAGVELFLKGNVPVLLLNNDSRTLAYVTFGMMQVLLIYFW